MIDLRFIGFDARGVVCAALLEDHEIWDVAVLLVAALTVFSDPLDVSSRAPWLSIGRVLLRSDAQN